MPHLLHYSYLHESVHCSCLLPHTVSRAPFVCKSNFCWLTLCSNGRFPFATSCHHFTLRGTLKSICTFHPAFCIAVQYGGWWMGPRPFTVWQMVIYQNQADNYPRFPPVPGLCLKVRQTDLPTVGLLAPRTAHTQTLLSILDISITLPFQCNLL